MRCEDTVARVVIALIVRAHVLIVANDRNTLTRTVRLALVILSAEIAVITIATGDWLVDAVACVLVAPIVSARIVVVTVDRGASTCAIRLALVVLGAQVPVIAGKPNERGVHASTRIRVAQVLSARVAVRAVHRGEQAHTVNAVFQSAWVAVIAAQRSVQHTESSRRVTDVLAANAGGNRRAQDVVEDALPSGGIANVVGAWVLVVAAHIDHMHTCPIDAKVLGAGVPVIAVERNVETRSRVGVAEVLRATVVVVAVNLLVLALAVTAEVESAHVSVIAVTAPRWWVDGDVLASAVDTLVFSAEITVVAFGIHGAAVILVIELTPARLANTDTARHVGRAVVVGLAAEWNLKVTADAQGAVVLGARVVVVTVDSLVVARA